jgi:hypothetical protein
MALLRALLAGFLGCMTAFLLLRIPLAIAGTDDASIDTAIAVAVVVLALAGAAGGTLGGWEGRRAGLEPRGAWLMGAVGAIGYGAVLSAGPGGTGYAIIGLAVLSVGAGLGATVPARRRRPASPRRSGRRRPGRYRPASP